MVNRNDEQSGPYICKYFSRIIALNLIILCNVFLRKGLNTTVQYLISHVGHAGEDEQKTWWYWCWFCGHWLALCSKKKRNRCWTKEWYKRRPPYTHQNFMEDLKLSDLNDKKYFAVESSSTMWATQSLKQVLICEKQSPPVSIYPLRYAICPL
jgi:hypothetical protein